MELYAKDFVRGRVPFSAFSGVKGRINLYV